MSLLSKLKSTCLNAFVKFLEHEKVQQCLFDSMAQTKQDIGIIENEPNPYFELSPEKTKQQAISERDDIIFITSRFRSGSTLLWNIFRNIDGCTSYYEPFNERRWFDKTTRGERVDNTHIGVDDYSKEYDDLEQLDKYYNEDWIRKTLLMDASTFAPDMKSYICGLIENANGRPILQFNRIDFRLPWLKHNFPNAKFIHLYRNPRDQWFSFLTDKKSMTKDSIEHTYFDGFYLNSWCNDLAKHFPFLDQRVTPHPYQRFYYLWKLSYLYGKKQCDMSFSLEQLSQAPKKTLSSLFSMCNIAHVQLTKAMSVIEKQPIDKWKQFADKTWFETLEQECEHNLAIFLSSRALTK